MPSKYPNKVSQGFTLIELMIVIAIIGVLAAIAIPQFSSYRQKSYNVKAKAELRSFYTACQAYFATHTVQDCDLDKVSDTFLRTGDVIIDNIGGGQAMLNTRAYHKVGTVTYTIAASGNISP